MALRKILEVDEVDPKTCDYSRLVTHLLIREENWEILGIYQNVLNVFYSTGYTLIDKKLGGGGVFLVIKMFEFFMALGLSENVY